MCRLVLVLLLFMTCVGSVARAEEPVDELAAVKRQAREERRREEELQLMRLELEKLKLEAETRKVLGETGASAMTSTSAVPLRASVEVRNIVIVPDGSRAVVDVGGVRQQVKEGSSVAGWTVKKINASDVVFTDGQNGEFRAGLVL